MRKFISFLFLLLICQRLVGQYKNINIEKVIKDLGHFKNILLIGYSPADIDTNLIQTLKEKYNFSFAFLGFTRGESQVSILKSNANGPIENGIVNDKYSHEILKKYNTPLYFTRAFDYPIKDSVVLSKLWNERKISNDLMFAIADFCPDIILIKSETTTNNFAKQSMEKCIENAFNFVKDSVDKKQFNYIKTRKIFSLAYYNLDTTTNNYSFRKILGDDVKLENEYFNTWKSLAVSPNLDEKISQIQKLNFTHFDRVQLDSLISIYDAIEDIKYLDDKRIDQKYAQLNSIIKRYAGINIQSVVNKSKYVIGDTISITSKLTRDVNNYSLDCHNFGFKNYDTIFNIHVKDSLVFTKSGSVNKNEIVSQPPWLSYGMETPGMYKFENSNAVKSLDEYNRVVSYYCSLDNHSIQFDAPVLDSLGQNPIITLPLFIDIAPGIIFPNIISELKHKNDLLVLNTTSNMERKNFPMDIRILKKGVKISGPTGVLFDSKEKILFSKDTILNLKTNQSQAYKFTVTHNTILPKDASPENKVSAKVESKQGGETFVYTSSLRKIDIDSLGSVYYHYQPSIIINPDTLTIGKNDKIGMIVPDSNYYSDIANALNQIYIKSKFFYASKMNYDSLTDMRTIIFNISNYSYELDTVLLKYIENGGSLIVNIQNPKTLPNFIKDSITISPFYLTENDVDYTTELALNSLFKTPNQLDNNILKSWKSTITNFSFIASQNSNWKNLMAIHLNDENKIILLEKKSGKGRIILSGLSINNQLELGITSAYRLLINLL
ncbi:hypothetical protein [Rhizosphaericola mali]|uniref:Uncharacterized protein n=1 Tax=Rhizosphaericola mali TaxID=2545455 RepID=A0A5P2G0T0_9BACT|nr:hypothetical protein [Rhizosphaericola mali]QES88258.1 hypothetical protein E0W69_006100 [Rhizosphaericola mali]